jgi:flagellar hook-basal body complex protein FliE
VTNSVTGLGPISALPNIAATPAADDGEGFSGILSNALQQVNQLSGGADQQVGALLQGGKTDMSSVMIAVEKADVAFQLVMQVRNKIVNAYQDIEKMQF